MKINSLRLTLTALVLTTAVLCSAAAEGIESKIKNVKVFHSGAVIEREAEINVQKGISTIKFTGLPAILDKKSIIITRKENTGSMVLDYNFIPEERKDLKEIRIEKETAKAEKLIRSIQEKIKIHTERTDFYEGLKKGINSGVSKVYNTSVNSETGQIEDLIFKGVLEEKIKLYIYADSLKQLNSELEKLKAESDSIKYIPLQTLSVNIESKEPVENTFVIKYFISNAGWYPFYNMNILSKSEKSKLDILATVYQETGEDWNDVKITVSTEKPASIQTIPNLNGIYLNKGSNYKLGTGTYRELTENKKENVREFRIDELDVTDIKTDFELKNTFTLKSGQRSLKAKMDDIMLKTRYRDIIFLNKNSEVNHEAYIKNSAARTIMKGNINLFLDDEFKGKEKLNDLRPDDSLKFSLGSDKSISVVIELLDDKTEDQSLFGNTAVRKISYEYRLKNNGRNKRKIALENFIPYAMNEKVKIKILEGKWNHNPLNGKIEAEIEMNPGVEIKLPMKYSIEYPKDENYIR